MYVELSGCFGEIQVIFKESADDRQRLTVDGIKRLITEDFFDEHLANRDRELVDQTPDTKGTISEYSTFSIKDLTDFECCACFFICTGKFTEIVGGIAVGNPCLCHGLRAEHINQHMSGIFEIFISFRRRKFTNNDDATVIDRSDKIVCACRKDIFDCCQGMLILRLSGCNEEDCPACSGGNVQFARTVKSLYFCIVSQKQFLHKRVFVIFFGKTFQDALNLADSQFTNR